MLEIKWIHVTLMANLHLILVAKLASTFLRDWLKQHVCYLDASI